MEEKKKLVLNCEVCDTRKMNLENYSRYENIVLNTELMIVSEKSNSILSELPIMINSEKTIMLDEGVDICLKSVNGSYEISGNSGVKEHTVLMVNGSLFVHSGTEEVLKKYEEIMVNGSVSYPKSLEGFMNKLSVNGSTDIYPDDCVILDSEFTIDKYFPLRAKEGSRYYVEDLVIVKDSDVDIKKLVQKNVHFFTDALLVPECKVEECVPLFDESVEFIVVPDGMKLIYDDVSLNEDFVRSEGGKLFIYGDVNIDAGVDMGRLSGCVEKLIIKGTVSLWAAQEAEFKSLDVEYDDIEIVTNSLKIKNVPRARIDAKLFENADDGIEVKNVASLKLKEDVTPEMILEKLKIKNCATVKCSEEQESAVASVAENVATISTGEDDEGSDGIGGVIGGIFGKIKDLANVKFVNAENYIM
ncbi:MAG: hypothetical protein NC433_16735 [Clostridiales bacterium]|nr:hypothetical protein [Clostridiales bacterium]